MVTVRTKIELSLYDLFGDGIRGRHVVLSVELSNEDVFAVDVSGTGEALFDPFHAVVENRMGGALKNRHVRNPLGADSALVPIGNQQDS